LSLRYLKVEEAAGVGVSGRGLVAVPAQVGARLQQQHWLSHIMNL
jgi:hypothetical protein